MPTLGNAADLAHAHLLLNHFPTIGTIAVFGILLIGLVRRNEHVQKVGLEAMFLIALATVPAYVTGNAVAETLASTPDVSAEAIAAHNDAALLGLVLVELAGAVAWVALWRLRRSGRLAGGMTGAVLALATLTIAAVSLAASLGGAIRHPELAGGQYEGMIGSPALLSAAGVQAYDSAHPYAWPISETLHFLGMSLMFGVLMLVNLRLVGWLRGISFAAVHRLLPLGMLGFAINLVTGMFFFIAKPDQYTYNVSFHWKIILLMLAGVTYLVLTVYDDAWELSAAGNSKATGKLLAAAVLVLSIGVMYFGRMLPYIGASF